MIENERERAREKVRERCWVIRWQYDAWLDVGVQIARQNYPALFETERENEREDRVYMCVRERERERGSWRSSRSKGKQGYA